MVYFGVRGKGCTQWGLLVSSVDPLSSTNYLTHSYDWGLSQIFLLTQIFDVEDRSMHYPIARHFSIGYIWINAL